LGFEVRVFIDWYGDIPYDKVVGVNVLERIFLLLLDCVLERPNILVEINFDRKYVARIVTMDTTIQHEQGRRRSTDYCE
jgi:hypothetical protein